MLKGLFELAQRYGDRRVLDALRPSLEAALAARSALAGATDADLAARAAVLRAAARERRAKNDAAADRRADERHAVASFAEACALACEAARRGIGLEPRPEQILAAAGLFRGQVVELATGEGKTLAAAIAAAVFALEGRHVHVIPPNDYLASRDAAQMHALFERLGIASALARPGSGTAEKARSYRADVVYGSGRELGFDFLRDPLRLRGIDRVQRGLDVAILDEIDSLLLDEAVTPLVLGGGGDARHGDRFRAITDAIEALRPELDFDADERGAFHALTEAGEAKLEALLRASGLLASGALYDEDNADLARVASRCLQARTMRRDRDYLVTTEGTVLPLDRHTGRAMQGRRWGDGLHQAIEAKERVPVRPEHAIRAMCAYGRFLGSYAKVVGMTGTARGIDDELADVHGLRVARIPPHVPCVREDEPDRVFLTERAKLEALTNEVERCHRARRPVVVGAPTEEKAAIVAKLLSARGVPCRTLTAKSHADEAAIVAQAGRAGAVTVATQVAGRGTDILLGGGDAEEAALVRSLGGLRVLGVERHASRRVDDQLRGRAGRAGDPGSSCFFVSLEDELLTRHAEPPVREAIAAITALAPDVDAKVRRYADDAQARAELNDAGRRALVRKLDEVYEEQRRAVEAIRSQLLSGRFRVTHADRPSPFLKGIRGAVRTPVARLVRAHAKASEDAGLGAPIRRRVLAREVYRLFGCEVALPAETLDEARAAALVEEQVAAALAGQWTRLRALVRRVMTAHVAGVGTDLGALSAATREEFGVEPTFPAGVRDAELPGRLTAATMATLRARSERELPRRVLRYFRLVLLDELERGFTAHLDDLGRLRDEIGLRGHVREDPIVGYKRRAYDAFRVMMADVERAALVRLLAAPPLDRGALDSLERRILAARRGTDGEDEEAPVSGPGPRVEPGST